MHEDAACGKGCGMEPMGCANCEMVTGRSYEYDPEYDYDYDLEFFDHYEEDDEGCDD
jgi:hypothetical protein